MVTFLLFISLFRRLLRPFTSLFAVRSLLDPLSHDFWNLPLPPFHTHEFLHPCAELEFLLPIMLAIMISKWIGDLLTEPLYESILRLKCIPFLEPDPVWITSLMDCKDIMSKPVVFLHAEETVGHILEVLHNCRHMSFPVVETVEGRDIFRGMILRSHLLVLLEQVSCMYVCMRARACVCVCVCVCGQPTAVVLLCAGRTIKHCWW